MGYSTGTGINDVKSACCSYIKITVCVIQRDTDCITGKSCFCIEFLYPTIRSHSELTVGRICTDKQVSVLGKSKVSYTNSMAEFRERIFYKVVISNTVQPVVCAEPNCTVFTDSNTVDCCVKFCGRKKSRTDFFNSASIGGKPDILFAVFKNLFNVVIGKTFFFCVKIKNIVLKKSNSFFCTKPHVTVAVAKNVVDCFIDKAAHTFVMDYLSLTDMYNSALSQPEPK